MPALVLAGIHWPALTENVLDNVFATQNVVILALTYPIVKLIHELGHGFIAKAHGGEVHELGVMFLVFFPVPYVDASSSTAFRSKYSRAGVAAAGILVEVLLAALAMYVWHVVEPGIVRAVAFNVMMICGFSTIVFNANPLLRFDRSTSSSTCSRSPISPAAPTATGPSSSTATPMAHARSSRRSRPRASGHGSCSTRRPRTSTARW